MLPHSLHMNKQLNKMVEIKKIEQQRLFFSEYSST